MEIRTVVLYAFAVVFAGLGLVLRVLPSRAAPATLAPAAQTAPVPGTTAGPATPIRQDSIAIANPFSPARVAPRVRYAPAGTAPQHTTVVARPRRPGLHLVGTLNTPGGTVALIDADPAIPGAEMYHVGDKVGDGKLISVDDSTAVVQGPNGRQVLRLP